MSNEKREPEAKGMPNFVRKPEEAMGEITGYVSSQLFEKIPAYGRHRTSDLFLLSNRSPVHPKHYRLCLLELLL